MAFTDSIKWNGKSIRDLFTEITHVKGRGKPPVEVRSVAIPGRHGRLSFKQTYKPRIIEIEGTIEGVSHATLMSNIENLKSLFAMEDELLSPGEESISDRFKRGRLEFGDETDRHYAAVFDGIFELRDISHQWMRNEMKLIRARFRCDEPFAISNTLTEATMNGNADEFKVFSTGNVRSRPVIELSGAVVNPMLIEGDKVGVAHFDYNDNLSDVTLSTISGNFASAFGYRTRKSLSSQQSKAIQIVNKDNLYFDRGTVISGLNYTNFNPHQGTIALWIKPYFNGDDGISHHLFLSFADSNNFMVIEKTSDNKLKFSANAGGTEKTQQITVTSSNFGAGTWYLIVARWDSNNNDFSGSGGNAVLDLVNSSEQNFGSGFGTIGANDNSIVFGQEYTTTPDGSSQIFDGLMYTEIHERALTDAEVTALYNSGAGVEPYVTPDTKLLSVGELSSGDPVSVQYPYKNNKFLSDGDMEVDPSGEWNSSAGSVVISNETTIVKYDLQSAKLVWSFAAAWADDSDDPVIYELYFDANNYLRLIYDWTNDKFIFKKRAAGVDYDAEAGSQTFAVGELLSVIGSYGPNGVKIYVNGVLGDVLNSNSAPLEGNPVTFFLSDNTQTRFPDAIIDEIYLFSRELSATEVLKYSIQSDPVKNNNAKISLTKTLSDGDKLLINSEKETIEFIDSSLGSMTNAIASMETGSFFPNMDSNESVLFNKVANAGIKLNYNKKWL